MPKPQDKFSGNEKDNLFVNFEIFGDPVPRIEWYKVGDKSIHITSPRSHIYVSIQGFKDLASEGEGSRFKTWTDGETNSAILGIEGLKQEDEGSYKIIVNNGGEDVEHEFNIYVTGTYVFQICKGDKYDTFAA